MQPMDKFVKPRDRGRGANMHVLDLSRGAMIESPAGQYPLVIAICLHRNDYWIDVTAGGFFPSTTCATTPY